LGQSQPGLNNDNAANDNVANAIMTTTTASTITKTGPEVQEAFPPELVGKFLFLSLFLFLLSVHQSANGAGLNDDRSNGSTPRQALQRPQQGN
jgi:hypothetical protein